MDLDCPTVRALAAATRANVVNNMTALLVVGFLALLAAVLFFVFKDSGSGGVGARFWWEFGAASLVYAVALVAFSVSVDWFVDHGHDVAAWALSRARRAVDRFQVAVTTAKRWADRYRVEGIDGMSDRSSRPHRSPTRTP
jgi:hypothetical protein